MGPGAQIKGPCFNILRQPFDLIYGAFSIKWTTLIISLWELSSFVQKYKKNVSNSKWVIFLDAKYVICQLRHGENKKVTFDEMIMKFALY